jgi:hypothetical protein
MPVPAMTALLGAHASGAWSPLNLSGLLGWWDASDTATITDTAGAVSALNDKSGNGYHFSKVGSGTLTTGSRTQNGLNVIDSAAGDDAGLSNASLSLTQDVTVAIVFKLDATSGFPTPYDSHTTTAFTLFVQSGAWRIATPTSVGAGSPAASTNTTLAEVYHNGASTTLTQNGGAATTSSPGTGGSNGFRVMNTRNTNTVFDGFLCECVVWDNNTDADLLRTYLNDKWAIF